VKKTVLIDFIAMQYEMFGVDGLNPVSLVRFCSDNQGLSKGLA